LTITGGEAPQVSGLDGLRALAALAVFGVHFNQLVQFDRQIGPFDFYRLLANGEAGVSLFFTLSGFLLALPFWRSLRSGQRLPATTVYAARRAARILPAYYLALTVLIYASGYWRFSEALPDILLHYGFLFNFTEFSIFSINPPFWTLAVELQFYAVLPVIFWAIRGLGESRAVGTIMTLCVVAYCANYALIQSVSAIVDWPLDPRLAWIRPSGAVLTHSILAHLPHFLIGVLAGPLCIKLQRAGGGGNSLIRRTSEAVFWCALVAVIAILGTELEDMIDIPYGRYVFPVVPLLLAAAMVAAPNSRAAAACLEGFPLRRLGVISYGIYIWHFPCLNVIYGYMREYGIQPEANRAGFAVLGLLLTVAAATVSYFALERPVLRAVRRVT
jgi:peptidoglycan/LPS O-acetylase OafA/YrhL